MKKKESKCWCEVCQTEIIGIKNWYIHIKRESHLSNVIKYLQYDLGALTIDEIPEKLEKYLGD